MGRKKWKSSIGLVVACALACMVLCIGCDRSVLQKYEMEMYRTQEDASLYDFTEQLADMGNVVATAMYDEERILFCEELMEGDVLHRKVWLFSYLTGEKTLCSDLEVTLEGKYQITSQRFSVLSAKPFVLCDAYEQKIYIYTEDFLEYSVIEMGEYAMPSGMFVREAGFYFMDSHTCKVYRHGMSGYETETKIVDYKAFREESQLVYEPDYNTTAHNLEDVSEDGDYLRLYAENLKNNEFYYYLYHVQTKKYEEMYQLDADKEALWSSWDGEKRFAEIVPSAAARYEMVDYTQKKAYKTKIEPEVVYSFVECDRMLSAMQDVILFYVIDEHTEMITELFLWKFAEAVDEEADNPPKKIMAELPREIDYAELTAQAKRLEEKYGIHIVMGENVTREFDAYDYVQVTDKERISLALEELELALNAFPDGMCEEMSSDYAIGFNIYLCGAFTPKNEENISDAGAFFVFENGYYNLAMNIMLENTESNVIHEMTHALDDYFEFCGASEQLEVDWQSCNPDGFEYLGSYFGYEELYEYTYAEDYETVDDIYFVDTYACTFPGEDRSRVFEFFGSEFCEGDWLLESDPLRRKARVLLDYCMEYLECFREDEEYGLKEKAEELGW